MPVDAQPAGTGGVKRAHGETARALVANELFQPFAHLARRAIGKRDGNDSRRVHVLVFHQVCDAVDDDASLSRAGAGQDQQRPFDRLNGFELPLVESIE
jgi:hypothetical protein